MGKSDRRRAPKRAKPSVEEEVDTTEDYSHGYESSWIRDNDANTPFGIVPVAMQSYFKEVNAQLSQMMQEDDPAAQSDEKKMLLQAALNEMNNNELMLATDPTCSLVLENMASQLDEKALRILLDRMTGRYATFLTTSFCTLASHRYGSHVLQSLLAACQWMLHTGVCTVYLPQATADASSDAHGVLRSLPAVVSDIYEEMEPSMPDMMTDAFASHTLRSLVALLAGVPMAVLEDLRSKKSAKYRSKERQKSMVNDAVWDTSVPRVSVPDHFYYLLYKLYQHLLTHLSEQQVHAMMPNAVAAPTLSLLLRLEDGLVQNDRSLASLPNSLTSLVLGQAEERTDFMEASLRDAVATHVLETALQGASSATLIHFWETYIQGRVAKLGGHPCANYVVATMLRLLPAERKDDPSPFSSALQELSQAGDQLVKHQMVGALQAAVERSVALGDYATEVLQAIASAFRFPTEPSQDDVALFVPMVLNIYTRKAYLHKTQDESSTSSAKRKRGNDEFTTQGSILLQRMLQLPAPHQDLVYQSLAGDRLATYCQSPSAAHVVIAALTSPSASYSQRRALLRSLMAILLDLCDDTWGSRVADTCWFAADGFTKEKIAQLVIQHEKRLLASSYGRFFVRRLRLGVYRKNVDEWKAWAQTETAPSTPESKGMTVNPFLFLRDYAHSSSKIPRKQKKGGRAEQELETIFSAIE
ncbi:Nucleolar protein 9 [Malassezia equina]|uniref:Nucleolar protein 9 n=1 Tax=Malassezia equina TaxID=1381935 RepID=A0AAF0IY84_9BASI|nr:Nucleolar protein 9 [Malassezia equina]